MDVREEFALNLLDVDAIRLSPSEPFTWASGLRSPIYCDNRILLSYPEIRSAVVSGLCGLSSQFGEFDAISGVATAGIAHGAFMAQQMNLPFSYVRSKAKAHGRQNMIEGKIHAGQRVLVVEDLISTGGSCLAAVEALRAEGCEVVGVIAIFQYLFEEARSRFEAANCSFATLTDYEALVGAARHKQLFDDKELRLLESWHLDPKSWSLMVSEN